MLNLQAVIERKVNEFPVRDCVIEKIVELPKEEYRSYRSNLIRDVGFITENKDLMYADGNGVQHYLMVLGQNHSEGVLIQSEGYDYARHASLIPGARDLVTTRLNQLAEQIIRDGTINTASGTRSIYFDEIKEQYGVTLSSDNSIGSMLNTILEARPEMAEVELTEDGYDMTFYLNYCPNLDKIEKLSSEILGDVFRLKDLIRVSIEDFHLVHHEVDMEPATIVYLASDTLTDEGKQEWGDVLNAQVLRVFHGIYGIQAECAGVDPQRLADFSLMLAGACPNKDYETWVRPEPDEPGMTLKL